MQTNIVLPPEGGKLLWIRGLGIRFLIDGAQTDGRLSLVEHPIQPKALAAPTHTHEREDEISYVVSGLVGVQIGEQVWTAGPGTTIFKPRGIPHAFWNAGESPASVLEVISPAGFEHYFEEMAALFAAAKGGLPDPERAAAVYTRYGLHLDFSSIPHLIAAHGLADF